MIETIVREASIAFVRLLCLAYAVLAYDGPIHH